MSSLRGSERSRLIRPSELQGNYKATLSLHEGDSPWTRSSSVHFYVGSLPRDADGQEGTEKSLPLKLISLERFLIFLKALYNMNGIPGVTEFLLPSPKFRTIQQGWKHWSQAKRFINLSCPWHTREPAIVEPKATCLMGL